MKIINYSMLAILAVGTLAPSIAQAQAGYRLCGQISVNGPVKIGLLKQVDDTVSNNNYNQKCDEAIKNTKDMIESNTELKAMQWEKIKKSLCDDVGNRGFVNIGQSPDLCDNMGPKYIYKVTKQGTANTTYEKQ